MQKHMYNAKVQIHDNVHQGITLKLISMHKAFTWYITVLKAKLLHHCAAVMHKYIANCTTTPDKFFPVHIM